MECLPDEVLLMIMEQLPVSDVMDTLGRVCRRWAALVRGRVLVIRRPSETSKLHPGLYTLQVMAYIPSPGPLIADVIQYVPRLRHLTVYAAAPLTSEHFAELERLSNLDHLDVFSNARVYDGRLAPVVRRLGSFVINESVAPGLLRSVGAKSNLRALYMYGRSMHYQRRELMTVIRARAEYLTELVLRCSELSDSAYEIIGGCCNLTALQLYSCWLMSATAALHVTRPGRLHKLHVTGARLVRSPALTSLVEQLPRTLLELDLSCGWFGDEHIEPLVSRVPTLRVFEAWRCRLTRDGAVKLASKFPMLETLDLDLMFIERHLKVLNTHQSLKLVRCLMERKEDEEEEPELPSIVPMTRLEYLSTKGPVTPEEYDELQQGLKEEAALKLQLEKERLEREVCPEQDTAQEPNEDTSSQSEEELEDKPEYKFRMISTDAKYARRYFRGGNEGYRATLFYYWTRNRQLEPLPPHMQPNYADEDGSFY